ncbi:MAG: hypothetical protein ING21_06965, partial [Burkholderiales bacterium]|nr:hypothetical protein [Burkholderiales bacterium]
KSYAYEVYVYRAINGNAFNGIEAVTVALTCTSSVVCQVPPTVTIPAGQNAQYFVVEGIGLGSTTVTASAVGYSGNQDLGVTVVTPQLEFRSLSDTTVGGNEEFYLKLTTPGAAYSGSQTAAAPITVNLTSSVPGVATVPPSVVIQAGSTQSPYATMTGVAAGTTTLTASGTGLTPTTSGVIKINP